MIQDVLVYIVGALLASAVVAAILYWRFAWSRDRGRFVTAATATFIGWVLWRTVLQLSNADNLDVDNPWLLGLSAQHVGSGVLAFRSDRRAARPGLGAERARAADRRLRRDCRRSCDSGRSVHFDADSDVFGPAAR